MSSENKFYPITSLCRDDLVEVIGEKKANKFSDSDMERLASKMSDDYLDQLYWDSMASIADSMFKEIRKTKVIR